MNERLILRAATNYRNWMYKCSLAPIAEHKTMIMEKMEYMQNRLEQIRSWSGRFLKGMTPRIQIEVGKSSAKHISTPSIEVYRNLVENMVPDLTQGLIRDLQNTSFILKAMVGEEACHPLSIKKAIEELTIVNKEWDKVTYKSGVLSVPIGPIILDDKEETVDLGDFVIHLNLNHPLVGLSIEAVNPVKGNEGYCHPHVKDGSLCAGEGEDIMQDALIQGRLEDYFRIVEAIVHTYNASSPYEPLSDWYAPSREGQSLCDICEEWNNDDYNTYCAGCNQTFCDNCNTSSECKSCEEWYCDECMSSCSGCGDVVCNSCNKECCDCDKTFCKDCIKECTKCSNEFCEECSVVCSKCGDDICHECIQECCNCGDTLCDSCMTVTCEKCGERPCEDCVEICPSCDKKVCVNCVSPCDDCGVSMCCLCKDEHNCLLAGISS